MSNPAFNLPNHQRHILPSNATDLEIAVDLACEDNLAKIPLDNIWKTWSADECPEHLLPWLAWALSIEEWEIGWTLETKREVLRQAVAIHRIRGTPQSINNDLATLDIDSLYTEWRDFGNGIPHTIRISLTPTASRTTPIDGDDIAIVRQKILRDKSQRDQLEIEQIAPIASLGMGVALAAVGGDAVADLAGAILTAPRDSASLVLGVGITGAGQAVAKINTASIEL